jgi:hypothetical protein
MLDAWGNTGAHRITSEKRRGYVCALVLAAICLAVWFLSAVVLR